MPLLSVITVASAISVYHALKDVRPPSSQLPAPDAHHCAVLLFPSGQSNLLGRATCQHTSFAELMYGCSLMIIHMAARL